MDGKKKQLTAAAGVPAIDCQPKRIHLLQIERFIKADPAYGQGVAKDLGLSLLSSTFY